MPNPLRPHLVEIVGQYADAVHDADADVCVGGYLVIIDEKVAEAKRQYTLNGTNIALSLVVELAALTFACLEMHGIGESERNHEK